MEVKTKVSSSKYGETGIEKPLYERYVSICEKNKTRMFLVFVDERLGSVYGEFFDILTKPFPHSNGKTYPKLIYRKGGVVPTYYFHLDQMKELEKLRPAEIEYLKTLREQIL